MAVCAARVPIVLALTALAASFSRSGVALLFVEVAANVRPASSSMNWTWIFLLVKQTLMRGRPFVPLTFWRTRQRRRIGSFCFCSVLISIPHGFGRELLKSQVLVSHLLGATRYCTVLPSLRITRSSE